MEQLKQIKGIKYLAGTQPIQADQNRSTNEYNEFISLTTLLIWQLNMQLFCDSGHQWKENKSSPRRSQMRQRRAGTYSDVHENYEMDARTPWRIFDIRGQDLSERSQGSQRMLI